MIRFFKALGATILLIIVTVVLGLAANFIIDLLFSLGAMIIIYGIVVGMVIYVFFQFYDLFKY